MALGQHASALSRAAAHQVILQGFLALLPCGDVGGAVGGVADGDAAEDDVANEPSLRIEEGEGEVEVLHAQKREAG
jgi:hypothetical protein